MSYGDNVAYRFRRAAIYVDKILKGVRPGDLPIEQPMTFQLVINLKTAKMLGLQSRRRCYCVRMTSFSRWFRLRENGVAAKLAAAT